MFNMCLFHIRGGSMAVGVRRITNRGIHRVIGKFASTKMKDFVWWESQIERDFIYYLEFDTDVIRYASQPVIIEYPFEGKIKKHIPDFEVWRYSSERRKFVENKPYEKTQKTEFIEKTRAITAFLLGQDIDYQVVTENDIRVYPRLENLKLLHRYSNVDITSDEATLIESLITTTPSSTLGILNQKIQQYDVSLQQCYALMAMGVIGFDLMVPLSFESIIWLSKNE